MISQRRWLNGGVLAGTLLAVTVSPAAERPVTRTPPMPPKVLRYDADTDQFRYFESVLNPVRRERAGGEVNYHGNRLTQYRFLGPRRQSGIYGALDDYKAGKPLDPRNYRYRW